MAAAAAGLHNARHHQKTRQKNSVRRRRLSVVMTASLVGILLTWTLTMKWISASSSSMSHASSTATETTQSNGPLQLDQKEWKVAKTETSALKNTSTTMTREEAPAINASFSVSNSTTTASPLDKIKVPFPIFIPSLPKSGTTSLHRYFICGKIWTAHTFVNTQDFRQLRVGECMQNNIKDNKAPFDTCGTYKVFSDAGFIRGNRCYYPSLHGGALSALAETYQGPGNPRSVGTSGGGFTLLYIRRSKEAWIQSMRHWKDGNLLRKWKVCPEPFPRQNQTITDEQWMDFYEYHAQTIRQFAKDHADTVTFIEVHLEDDDIAQQLEAKIGINASCWGHHNSHEKRLKLNPKFRAKALALQQQQQEQQPVAQ